MKNLIPVQDLNDDQEFYKGERFRRYGVGLANTTEESDYYEYMLIYDQPPHMIMVNVSSEAGLYKAGSVICYVPLHNVPARIVVSGKEIKRMFGTENTFHLIMEKR
jgi:hypothetical protein